MDFTTDNNPTPLYTIINLLGDDEIPSYVREADVITKEATENLSLVSFADIANREYPIFNKQATWLSAAYFYGSGGKDTSRLMGRIKKAAATHGIIDDIEVMEQALETRTKEASYVPEYANESYALVLDFNGHNDRGLERYYPINNFSETIDSATQMAKDATDGRLPINYLRDASIDLVKAAKAQGVDSNQIPDRIWNLGTERLVNYDAALDVADQRKWAGVPDAGIELYKDVVKSAMEHGGDTEQWIECWNNLDMIHNVKYSSTIIDPYQAWYSGESIDNIKAAAESNVIVHDVAMPVDAFLSIPRDQIDLHFDETASGALHTLQKKASEGDIHFVNENVLELSKSQQKKILDLAVAHG
jgi:hypothetical protein